MVSNTGYTLATMDFTVCAIVRAQHAIVWNFAFVVDDLVVSVTVVVVRVRGVDSEMLYAVPVEVGACGVGEDVVIGETPGDFVDSPDVVLGLKIAGLVKSDRGD
ncbi:hypothetical protein EXE48_11645 [Halorubrum sp. ASP1]|nr:hypothetical protein [Halorubrum sp. ASP1]TKX60619.1 hypothetical protein EXE48_11645 [Halorubrum sp. ASP1]